MIRTMLFASAVALASPAFAQTTAPAAPAPAPQTAPAPAPADPMSSTMPSTPTTPSDSTTATPAAPAESTSVAAVVEAEFTAYDKDKSGELSRDEFNAWMTKLGSTGSQPDPKIGTAEWNTAAFAQADTDKNKTVSKTELTSFLQG